MSQMKQILKAAAYGGMTTSILATKVAKWGLSITGDLVRGYYCGISSMVSSIVGFDMGTQIGDATLQAMSRTADGSLGAFAEGQRWLRDKFFAEKKDR